MGRPKKRTSKRKKWQYLANLNSEKRQWQLSNTTSTMEPANDNITTGSLVQTATTTVVVDVPIL